MKPQEIQERNKQIALMLGKKYENNLIVIHCRNVCGVNPSGETWQECSYHSDWNWLMESVEFIEKLKFNTKACIHCNNDRVYLKTYPAEYSHSAMFTSITDSKVNFCYALEPTKKEAVFIAVSDFAKLYNEKKL
jgi:hypothetical protein